MLCYNVRMGKQTNRTIHPPISLTVESVSSLRTERDIPQLVEVPLDLKGDAEGGRAMIDEIERQLKINPNFWALSIIATRK